jgi:acetyl esterase/lipase
VHRNAVYGVNITHGVVYAQGLYCNGPNFTQSNCSVVNLTADVLRPIFNATTGMPLPTAPMPVLLGIHGGSYSHGGSNDEVANAEYFVQRGWLGISINYRLCNGGYGNLASTSSGNLVCQKFGNVSSSPSTSTPILSSYFLARCMLFPQFPTTPPFANKSADFCLNSVKSFGINTADGCPLSAPPKNGSFFGTLLSWMYPSMRDAKAAVRWIRANANSLDAAPEFITAVGGSAGACSVVGLATTFEKDYKMELSTAEDPTLASTNLAEKSSIATGLVQWGGDYVPIFTQLRDPVKQSRYSNANAPLATYHGSDDGVISPKQETTLKAAYQMHGVPYEQHILQGAGHGAGSYPVALPDGTNQTQHDNMFDFVTKIQKLSISPK